MLQSKHDVVANSTVPLFDDLRALAWEPRGRMRSVDAAVRHPASG